MKPQRKTAASDAKKKTAEEYLTIALRTAQRAFESSQRQPKMTAEEMREQVRRNEIDWARDRYK